LIVPGLQTEEPIPAAVREQVKKAAEANPTTEIVPFTRPEADYLTEFLDDEFYYKKGVQAGSLDAIQKMFEDNFNFAEKISIPLHASTGKHDKLVTAASIKTFIDRTPSTKKVVDEYESDHYLLMDGFFKE